MEAYWWILYFVIAAAAIVQSFLLGMQAWENSRYARSCMGKMDRRRPTGRVMLCVPCKGHDLELDDNLRALLEQDYDDYEVVFIVESADDPSYPVIRRAMAAHSWMPARLIVAGRATDCGQKVHNLLAATARIAPRIDYLAFADSDARPRPEWLRLMVARLHRPNIGAVTGYRWLVPKRNTIVNNILYSLNSDITSLIGRDSHYMVWGGSWAIRRELFERIQLRSVWKNKLCDDLVASNLLAKNKLQVRFEPACVVATPIDNSLQQAVSFVRRQYMLGRFYTRTWWAFALIGYSFSSLTWLGNFGLLAYGLSSGARWSWIPAVVISLLYILKVCRDSIRQKLVDTYFPHLRKTLHRSKQFDIWLHPVTSLIHAILIWSSAAGLSVSWRGINYKLTADGKIEHIWHSNDPASLPMPGIAGHKADFSDNMASLKKAG